MQKMLYWKTDSYRDSATPSPDDLETVWMVSADSENGMMKAIIMRNDPGETPNGWDSFPYETVKLSRLRPLPEDFNKVFCN